MDKDIIMSQGLYELSQYFRRKLTQDVEKMYKEKLEPYHHKTIATFFQDWMDQQERFPYLHEVMSALQRLEELPVDYKNHPEKFPIGKMWEAFNILERNGEKYFINYCNNSGMPLEDRQRVLAKYDYSQGKEKAKGIAKDLFESVNKDGMTDEQIKTEKLREKARQIKKEKLTYKEYCELKKRE